MRVSQSWLARAGRGTRTLVVWLWIISVCVVVTGSVLPASALHRLHFDELKLNDKLVHFANYAVLGGLPVLGWEPVKVGMIFSATMIPLGAALELIQTLVPGRTCEFGDLIANSLGVLAGVLLGLAARTVGETP